MLIKLPSSSTFGLKFLFIIKAWKCGKQASKIKSPKVSKLTQERFEIMIKFNISFQPSQFFNMSTSVWMNLSSPLDSAGNYDRCRIFDIDFANITSRPAEDSPTVACSAWDFDQELFKVIFFKLASLSGFYRSLTVTDT